MLHKCMIVIFTLVKFSGIFGNSASVELPLGKIEGSLKTSVHGQTFYVFEGVPYAKPPVGDLRFKSPEPVEKWLGVRKATTVYKCFQYRHVKIEEINDAIVGEEDCLYLNIYTPSFTDGKLRNVIVFIHGGAFMFNYGAFQGPDLLLDHDVVYVNLNYRLGPLGFLSTEDDVVPGNMGIKDQIMALKWIKENIKYFGGNPESVTITGNSAGGASVHIHYLLPESKGLFHRGYSQSGCILNPWVIMEKPLQNAKKLSVELGCPSEDSEQMIACFRQRTAKEIAKSVKHLHPWLYNPFSPFGIVVDTWARDPLLPDHPYKLLKEKRVVDLPWIVSHTNSEGLYPASEFYSKTEYLEYIDKNWNEVLPHILDYNHTVAPDSRDTISSKIRKQYLGERALSKESFMDFLKIISDRLYIMGIGKAARLHAAAVSESPVYYAYFTYRGAHSRSELRANTHEDLGAAHGDDMSYVLKNNLDTMSTEDDRKMTELLVKMWITYAQTGEPKVPTKWRPLSHKIEEDINYLHIKSPSEITMKSGRSLGYVDFWENLEIEENEKWFPIKDEL